MSTEEGTGVRLRRREEAGMGERAEGGTGDSQRRKAAVSPFFPCSLSRIPVACLLLLVFTALPYLTALRYDFVYDDHGQLVENPFLLNPARVFSVLRLETLGDPHVVNGRRPLVLFTYFRDRAWWGRNPAGYHFTNLLVHAGAVIVLYLLLRRLGQGHEPESNVPFFAFAAALLFGMHPVLTEAVHVPSFRPDPLFALFVAAHLLIARSLPETYTWRWLLRMAGAALTMGLALGSKEAAVVAPLLLLLMWYRFPVTRPERGTVLLLLAIDLGLIAGYAALCRGGAPLQATSGSWNGLSLRFPANLCTGPWLWLQYLGLLVWPHPLIADRVVEPVSSLGSAKCLAGILALVAAAAVALGPRRRTPWPGLAAGWMLLGFLPVSNLVPLINPMAERYLYFMAMGFGILLAWAVCQVRVGGRHERTVRRGLLAGVAGVYLLLCFARLPDWKDDFTLWQQTLRDEPGSARAHTWVGLELKRQKRVEEALRSFETAERLNPRGTSALVNLAILHGQAGALDRAEALLREAIRRRPEKPEAYWNLALDLQLQGRSDEAFEVLQECLRYAPMHLRARQAVTERLVEEARFAEALAMVEGTLEIDPGAEQALEFRDYLRWQLNEVR